MVFQLNIYLQFYNYRIIDHNFNIWNLIEIFSIKRYNVLYINGFTSGEAFKGFEKFSGIGSSPYALVTGYLSLKNVVIDAGNSIFTTV